MKTEGYKLSRKARIKPFNILSVSTTFGFRKSRGRPRLFPNVGLTPIIRYIMSKKDALLSEIEQVPDSFIDEVLDFVHFLKTKIIKERLDTAIASESSLKKDLKMETINFIGVHFLLHTILTGTPSIANASFRRPIK